jgi:nucleoid-associated protein YgaU
VQAAEKYLRQKARPDSAEKSRRGQSPSLFYTVKPGDNLWKIAESQYGPGQGEKNHLIYEANKPILSSPDQVHPGQVLRIPSIS